MLVLAHFSMIHPIFAFFGHFLFFAFLLFLFEILHIMPNVSCEFGAIFVFLVFFLHFSDFCSFPPQMLYIFTLFFKGGLASFHPLSVI